MPAGADLTVRVGDLPAVEIDVKAVPAEALAQAFPDLVRHRRGFLLLEWIRQAEQDAPKPMQGFAGFLCQDLDAVTAGLTLPWSSGAVEGNVNRVKTLKRAMYGRASFSLLRTRILKCGVARAGQFLRAVPAGAAHLPLQRRSRSLGVPASDAAAFTAVAVVGVACLSCSARLFRGVMPLVYGGVCGQPGGGCSRPAGVGLSAVRVARGWVVGWSSWLVRSPSGWAPGLGPGAHLAEMKQSVPVSAEAQQLWPDGRYGLGLAGRSLTCGGTYWGHEGGDGGYIILNGVTGDGRRSAVVFMSEARGDTREHILAQGNAAGAVIDHCALGPQHPVNGAVKACDGGDRSVRTEAFEAMAAGVRELVAAAWQGIEPLLWKPPAALVERQCLLRERGPAEPVRELRAPHLSHEGRVRHVRRHCGPAGSAVSLPWTMVYAQRAGPLLMVRAPGSFEPHVRTFQWRKRDVSGSACVTRSRRIAGWAVLKAARHWGTIRYGVCGGRMCACA
ncbi:transposase [Streptomyces abikoensis]|uniref:Transposase n=1 Tax=Streptomyces abikoensis TaxID=97398 RepID=A0ABW7TDA5_9ACTN